MVSPAPERAEILEPIADALMRVIYDDEDAVKVVGRWAVDLMWDTIAPLVEEQMLRPNDAIGDAWRAVEAAAPPEALIRAGRTGMTATGWATAYLHGDHLATTFSNDGVAAALRDLIAKLPPSIGGNE